MFKSPFASMASEDKGASKKAPMAKSMKASEPEDHDDVAKSMTVNQHHDGHYSSEHPETGETHDHENLEALKDHMSKFFDEEENEGRDVMNDAEEEAPAKGSSVHKGMY